MNEVVVKNKSAKKTIDVLNCFIAKQPLGVTEVSEILKIYKSNAYDIISTLVAMDYLTKDPESNKYYLGGGAARLGKAASLRFGFQKVAVDSIYEISKIVGETVYFTIPRNNLVYYVEAAVPNHGISMEIRDPFSPMHCTGSGKAMLAFSPKAQSQAYIEGPLVKYTPYTITDPRLLEQELADIRAKGYAEDKMEYAIGLNCIAVPLVKNGEVKGAISVSGASAGFTEENKARYLSILRNYAEIILQYE